MTKYIDAGKLIAKIVELRKELPNTIEHLNDEESGFARGQQYELTAIEAEIICLQQEQPEVDLVAELEHHLATTPKEQLEKEWKELEPWNNVGPTVQEFLYGKQPEVDLEKEVINYLKTHQLHIKDGGRVVFDNDDSPNFMCDIRDIARHFAEWGAIHLNARKEGRK